MEAITIDNFEPAGAYAAAPMDSSIAIQPYPDVPAGGRCRLGFALFILVNAVLFIRPAEIVPAWEALPIYQVIIIACLLASWPVILTQLTWSSLRENPITLCVIGLLPAIVLSHLSHGDTFYARAGANEFLKVVLYYLLMIGLVDSPKRLRQFLLIITCFVIVTAILTLLNHYGVIEITALDDLLENYDPDLPREAQSNIIVRIQAMGIFHDPNDFCLILNFAAFVCLHRLLERKDLIRRIIWGLPIAVSLTCVALTQSRGGFLGLLAGLIVFLFSRLPRKRAVWISLIVLPFVFALFAGRSTNIDVNDDNDTAQGRIHLWRDAMVVFHHNPFFGIGEDKLAEEINQVAHNSYVHSYAELGFFGGTLFVGAFYLSVVGLRSLKFAKSPVLPADLVSLRLCLLPVLSEYMVGIYSLSRNYVNTTYLVLGLVAAFLILARETGADVPFLNRRLGRNVVLASVACVMFFEVFVRTMAR